MRRCCGDGPFWEYATTRPSGNRVDLNTEIIVVVDGLDREASLVLVEISESGARFRAGVKLPPQAGLSFNWIGPSRESIVVHGHVSDFKMLDSRTAEYEIRFTMPDSDLDQLAIDLAGVRRRKSLKAVEPPPQFFEEVRDDDAVDNLDDVEPLSAAKRQAYRAVVQFKVDVRVNKQGRWTSLRGEARDLSMSGILMQLPEELEEGTELELAFALPSDGHRQAGKSKDVVELTPFGERKVKKGTSASLRTYETIHTSARIVKKLEEARGSAPMYGVSFFELSPFLNEELARWIHEHQLKQVRNISGGKRPAGAAARREAQPAAGPSAGTPAPRTKTRFSRPVYVRTGKGLGYIPAALRSEHHLVAVAAKIARLRSAAQHDIFAPGSLKHAHDRQRPAYHEQPQAGIRHTEGDVFGIGVREERANHLRRRANAGRSYDADIFGLGASSDS